MNAFYEKHRDEATEIHIKRSAGHAYPSHFHRNVELLILLRGRYALTINGERQEVGDGTVVFIDCYDIHSYENLGGDEDGCVIIIPYTLAERFNAARKNKEITSNTVHSAELCRRMLSVVDDFIAGEESSYTRASAAELILSLLHDRLSFREGSRSKEGSLMRSILCYIQDNYREKISRADISKALGYTPEHISRVFHKYMRRSVNDYINSLRLEFIDYHRSLDGAPSLAELIYLSGFGSEQTYYRARRREKTRT